jgi:hypothetical protein
MPDAIAGGASAWLAFDVGGRLPFWEPVWEPAFELSGSGACIFVIDQTAPCANSNFTTATLMRRYPASRVPPA